MNRNSVETRRRILAAGETVFSRNGYRAATVREIQTLARVNLAAIHYHFGSKEKLYLAICRGVAGKLADLSRKLESHEVASAADWRAALDRFVRTLLDFFTQPDRASQENRRMLRWERVQPSRVRPLLIRDFYLPMAERLEALLRRGLPLDVDPGMVLTWRVTVLAQCFYYEQADPATGFLFYPADWTRAEWLDRTTRHMVDGICARLTFRPAEGDPL